MPPRRDTLTGRREPNLDPEIIRTTLDHWIALTDEFAQNDFWCQRCVTRIAIGQPVYLLDGGIEDLYCSRHCATAEIDRRREKARGRNAQRNRSFNPRRAIVIREQKNSRRREVRDFRLDNGPGSRMRTPVLGPLVRWLWRDHVYRQQRRMWKWEDGQK